MPEFEVIYEGTVREVYYVEAETEDEAWETWADAEPDISEVIDGGPVSVKEVDDA